MAKLDNKEIPKIMLVFKRMAGSLCGLLTKEILWHAFVN
jgi:hypothetical protein